ncbi:biotin--protein ligase isoform X1 [Syngnathus scovelli]|uniref:biotin--protein ligase isoform X1 n=1 Tax=Syngnathus scovelli TaxID=161590 RepID=UPI00210FB02F|nr:biotin--protein ligase isoform X1 [Syngnathus scovelli]
MLITLCYVYLWVRFHKCCSELIGNSVSRLTSSLRFFRTWRRRCSSSSSVSVLPANSVPSSQRSPVLLQLGDESLVVAEFKDLQLLQLPKWSDFCRPLACRPGRPLGTVAQASVDNFGRLAAAFFEDRLQLDNGLVPSKIALISLHESILGELIQCPVDVKSVPFDDNNQGVNGQPLSCRLLPYLQNPQFCQSEPLLTYSCAKKNKENQRESGLSCFSQDQGTVSEQSHLHMENHRKSLHLSSCPECLELENSTILSVKYTSSKSISNTPPDDLLCLDSEDGTFPDSEKDAKSSFCKSHQFEYDHKLPPNVLVYTNGSKERFRAVRRLLTECLDMEKYTIYSLQPHQVLSEPWMENSRLLVLAEEEVLTPQLHTRFLNYLSNGGSVLGLASSLCPAGISLENREQQPRQVRRLSFTPKDSTQLELSVLASGKVFVRDVLRPGTLELWGEIKDGTHRNDMVIIRLTRRVYGGEAVLCQIHLENIGDFQKPATEVLDGFKVNTALHYQLVTEILTSLGLDCQQAQNPPAPSPVYLLATSQEAKAKFVQCLSTHLNQDGLVVTSKASLRIVSSRALQDAAFAHDCSLPLVTDGPESQSWANFCLDTYGDNLTTVLLGHTLLYAEVVSSTMDLVEGLNLHLPEDVGLIVIAAQQSQGKGRGRNTWLSPLGCAMFTLCVQIKLNSRLGKRISFLQHLAALAVIEAVRTLPGYEDIDLRVKWPNDIYYGRRLKLGGVLVTSTVMGSTFHLLIGCGFNVSNSNPTVCINDLIQQYNIEHNCKLQALNCAQLIARTVSCLEAFIEGFQRHGAEAILPVYYKRWLHSGSLVHLWSENGPEAEVVGLDSNGFLQVHSTTQGIISVEPDGNSFDMLKNLVVIKQH